MHLFPGRHSLTIRRSRRPAGRLATSFHPPQQSADVVKQGATADQANTFARRRPKAVKRDKVRIHRLCRTCGEAQRSRTMRLTAASYSPHLIALFTTGESLLKQFKVTDAKRFARQFCNNCGSQVARFVPEIDGVVIPAGSLDDEIPIKPQAKIFWNSRADWSCDGDSFPRYAEYPD